MKETNQKEKFCFLLRVESDTEVLLEIKDRFLYEKSTEIHR